MIKAIQTAIEPRRTNKANPAHARARENGMVKRSGCADVL